MMTPARPLGTCLGACLCACIWLVPDARAQVLRCTDAGTGKVTYTNGACPGGAHVRQVQQRQTPEEIQRERAQAAEAAEALARRQALHDAQEERARLATKPPKTAKPADHAHSPECARSRRHLETVFNGISGDTYEQSLRVDAAQRQVDLDCLGPEAYADLEKARAARPLAMPPPVLLLPRQNPTRPAPIPVPPRKPFTQCNVFRCYDGQGNSYPR